MSTFEVQSIEISAPFSTAFRYIADPANLPEWTHAFKRVSDGHAMMETPAGAVQVGLRVQASEPHGTIDWMITFPDGGVAKAASRVTPHGERSIYTFVLEAPPVPLERLEGALAEQSRILGTELATLARRFGENGRTHV
jgi:polyketide cyclase/dehydrase/lipid transport protein